MAKLFTLKKNTDFSRVYSRGKSVADKFLVVYCYPNKENSIKFGYSISKKIGGAVVRNRLRRLLKEICRKQQVLLVDGVDIIIIARKPVVDREYSQVQASLMNLFRKAKLLKEENNA